MRRTCGATSSARTTALMCSPLASGDGRRRYSRHRVQGRHGIAVLLIVAMGALTAAATVDAAGARGTQQASHACKKKGKHHRKRHGRCRKDTAPAPQPQPPQPPPEPPPLPPCPPCLEGPCPMQGGAIVCPPRCPPPCPPGVLCPLALTYP